MSFSIISWQAPEFEAAERSSTWYLWSMGIALLLVVVAFVQENILFALFIVIAEVVILLLGHAGPAEHVYAFTNEGLLFDDKMVRLFTDVNGYAFFDLGGRHVELIMHPAKKFQQYSKVLIPREKMDDMKQFLSTKMHPFEYTPAVADTMAKWLRL
jgi:hypothetical protein